LNLVFKAQATVHVLVLLCCAGTECQGMWEVAAVTGGRQPDTPSYSG